MIGIQNKSRGYTLNDALRKLLSCPEVTGEKAGSSESADESEHSSDSENEGGHVRVPHEPQSVSSLRPFPKDR